MNIRTRELRHRRAELLAHIAWQRRQLGRTAENAAAPLRAIDLWVLSAHRFLTQSPVLLGVASIISVIGPRGIVRTLARKWLASAGTRRLLRLLSAAR